MKVKTSPVAKTPVLIDESLKVTDVSVDLTVEVEDVDLTVEVEDVDLTVEVKDVDLTVEVKDVDLTVEVEDVLQSGSWDVAELSLEYKGAPVLIGIIIEEYELHCLNSNRGKIDIYT